MPTTLISITRTNGVRTNHTRFVPTMKYVNVRSYVRAVFVRACQEKNIKGSCTFLITVRTSDKILRKYKAKKVNGVVNIRLVEKATTKKKAGTKKKKAGTKKKKATTKKKAGTKKKKATTKKKKAGIRKKKATTNSKTLQSKIVKKFGKEATRLLSGGWQFRKQLGKGQYGEAYQIGNAQGDIRVVKLMLVDKLYEGEYEALMQIQFYSAGIAPRVHSTTGWKRSKKHVFVIVMDRVDDTFHNFLKQKRSDEELAAVCSGVSQILDRMCRVKFRHNDFHWENVGIVTTLIGDRLQSVPTLFDFGFASVQQKTCDKVGELYQLVRTMGPDFTKGYAKSNVAYLLPKLQIDLANTIGGTLPNKFWKNIDSDESTQWRKYRSTLPTDTQMQRYVKQHKHKLDGLEDVEDMNADEDEDEDYVPE